MSNSEIILKDNVCDHFTLITYPDGQHSIMLDLKKFNSRSTYIIKCRIRNFSELEVLFLLVKSLKRYDISIDLIEFIYLFGLRSDRCFSYGGENYVVDILNPIIKLLDCHIVALSPHNDRLIEAMPFYFSKYVKINEIFIFGDENSHYAFGTVDHLYQVQINNLYRGCFSKTRFNGVPSVSIDIEKIKDAESIIIIDDLCDGGATFIEEAKYLKKFLPNVKLRLLVVHGIFSQGLTELLSYYDEIICTNSYQDIHHPKVKQIKVI